MDKNKHNSRHGSVAFATTADTQTLSIADPEFAEGDLGRIQDLLYGEQLRSNKQQITELNSQVELRLQALTNMCQQQFSELSKKIEDGIAAMTTMQQERDKAFTSKLTAVTQSQAVLQSSLSDKLQQNIDSSAHIQQQLNSEIKKSTVELTESLGTTRNELMPMLEAATAELHSKKMDRASLSQLFGEFASQLSTGNSDLANGKAQGQDAQTLDKTIDSK